MKRIAIIALAGLTVFFTDCKSKSSAKSTGGTTVAESPTQNGEQKIKYRLVISFTSHASGIDGPKYDAITGFLDKHPKKPAYDILPWGREGERDYCLHLKEMNSSEQKTFIEEVKKLAQGSDRVLINENTERVKKAQ